MRRVPAHWQPLRGARWLRLADDLEHVTELALLYARPGRRDEDWIRSDDALSGYYWGIQSSRQHDFEGLWRSGYG
jgi:hypothetical protein